MYQKEDLIMVYVYRDRKLFKQVKFNELNPAHRFIESQTSIGYYCVMQRLEDGRPWCTMKYWPKESI